MYMIFITFDKRIVKLHNKLTAIKHSGKRTIVKKRGQGILFETTKNPKFYYCQGILKKTMKISIKTLFPE